MYAQIRLKNASFEGRPQDATVPVGWESCGYYSTPDIMPGPWGVYQKAAHGNTYIGLITREDRSWEVIGQKLNKKLEAETCYEVTVNLAYSPAYAGYNKPARLRIWAGTSICDKKQLLVKSPTIDHFEWESYTFMFFTEEAYSYLLIECFYKEETLFPYRGNILVDGFSEVKSCNKASLMP